MKPSIFDTSTQNPSAKKRAWSMLLLPLSLLIFFAIACNTGFVGPTETREDSFAVGQVLTIIVNGGNGSVTVNAGDEGLVAVHATLTKPDDIEYKAVQEGNTITVEAKEKNTGIFDFGQDPGADIDITAPSNARVELRTGNGAIEVNSMHQSGTAKTSNGKIVMSNVTGNFDVSTSNGGVDITQAKGTFDIKTSNGRIEFNGEIDGGSNRMTTSNGSIDIKLQGTPSVKVDASASNGSVVSNIPITIASSVDEKHLVGTIGNGDAELFIETSNGSITIQ